MKKIALFLVLGTGIVLLACQGSGIKRGDPLLTEEQIDRINSQQPEPQTVFASLSHFYCENNCEGSGGDSEGFCPVCGSAYLHNAAFHNQENGSVTSGTTEVPLPSQNSAGIWHYSCPNGHAGGANSAEACSECGATMIHNATYHDQASNTSTPISPNSPEPPKNSLGLWHYVCPNGHQGGGGSAAESCSECGSSFVHNSLYHQQSNATGGGANPPPGAVSPNRTPEPAQNAKGTWHYTCPNGHAGGAGTTEACSECGTTLVHNGAYHSN